MQINYAPLKETINQKDVENSKKYKLAHEHSDFALYKLVMYALPAIVSPAAIVWLSQGEVSMNTLAYAAAPIAVIAIAAIKKRTANIYHLESDRLQKWLLIKNFRT
jgi:hypothetical protein